MSTEKHHINESLGQKNITVKIGDCLIYTFHKHESVGFDAAYHITDPELLNLTEETITYQKPEQLKEGRTGGDQAQGTFIFKALKEGKTTLTLQTLFRFKLEKEYKIQIQINQIY